MDMRDIGDIGDIDTSLVEGKYLIAAMTILATSDFMYKGKVIKGSSKTPDEILSLLGETVTILKKRNKSKGGFKSAKK
ncbi:MAG: hypothetical protein ABF289_18425 [Clostridiales bacterium]